MKIPTDCLICGTSLQKWLMFGRPSPMFLQIPGDLSVEGRFYLRPMSQSGTSCKRGWACPACQHHVKICALCEQRWDYSSIPKTSNLHQLSAALCHVGRDTPNAKICVICYGIKQHTKCHRARLPHTLQASLKGAPKKPARPPQPTLMQEVLRFMQSWFMTERRKTGSERESLLGEQISLSDDEADAELLPDTIDLSVEQTSYPVFGYACHDCLKSKMIAHNCLSCGIKILDHKDAGSCPDHRV